MAIGPVIKLIVIAMLFQAHLVVLPQVSIAATNQGFSCDVKFGACKCDVDVVGDCDAMKRNCKDGKILTCGVTAGKKTCVIANWFQDDWGKKNLKIYRKSPMQQLSSRKDTHQ